MMLRIISRCLIGFFLYSPFGAADVAVKLQEPDWQFVLQNSPLSKTAAQLSPGERSFAAKIQPLLAAQNFQAVREAFADRDLAGDSAALKLLRGQVLLSLRVYPQAEAALRAALREMPDLALAHRSLSMLYMLQKQYEQARTHLRRSIELGVADAQLYGQLAFINLQAGNPASAVSGYQQALFMEPDNQQWRQGLLYALLHSRALDQAQALVEEMLQADNGRADLWLLRGQIALQREREQEALSSLEIALRLGNRSPENLALAAQLHLRNGSVARAVDLLSQNLGHLNSGNRDAMLSSLDQVLGWLIYQEHWAETAKLLQSLDSIKGKLPAGFDVYRAQYALHRGDNRDARHRLNSALQADPTRGDALLTLGDLHLQQRQFEQALLYYVRAEALPGFKERALLSRAQLEIDRRNYPEALRVLRQVVQLNPARSDILANIRSLENMVRNAG